MYVRFCRSVTVTSTEVGVWTREERVGVSGESDDDYCFYVQVWRTEETEKKRTFYMYRAGSSPFGEYCLPFSEDQVTPSLRKPPRSDNNKQDLRKYYELNIEYVASNVTWTHEVRPSVVEDVPCPMGLLEA